MPVILGKAKLGTVVKPPKNAMLSNNAFVLLWEKDYVVVSSDKDYVWLDLATKKRSLNVYQCQASQVFLTKDDPRPEDRTRLSGPEQKKKSTSKKPLSFEFDYSVDVGSLPFQARTLVHILNSTGKNLFTVQEVELALRSEVEKLKTRQDPMKIFVYYVKLLIKKRVVTTV